MRDWFTMSTMSEFRGAIPSLKPPKDRSRLLDGRTAIPRVKMLLP
jgi:hypothetical protein